MTHLGHRLSALIDDELDLDGRDRVLVHLAKCEDCRREAVALRTLKRRMNALGGETEADSALTGRLMGLASPSGGLDGRGSVPLSPWSAMGRRRRRAGAGPSRDRPGTCSAGRSACSWPGSAPRRSWPAAARRSRILSRGSSRRWTCSWSSTRWPGPTGCPASPSPSASQKSPFAAVRDLCSACVQASDQRCRSDRLAGCLRCAGRPGGVAGPVQRRPRRGPSGSAAASVVGRDSPAGRRGRAGAPFGHARLANRPAAAQPGRGGLRDGAVPRRADIHLVRVQQPRPRRSSRSGTGRTARSWSRPQPTGTSPAEQGQPGPDVLAGQDQVLSVTSSLLNLMRRNYAITYDGRSAVDGRRRPAGEPSAAPAAAWPPGTGSTRRPSCRCDARCWSTAAGSSARTPSCRSAWAPAS